MASSSKRVKYADDEKNFLKWFAELSDEEQQIFSDVDDSNDEELSKDNIMDENHSSTSEQETDVEDDHYIKSEPITNFSNLDDDYDTVQSQDVDTAVVYKGKNGYTWNSKEENINVETPNDDIVIKLSSLKLPARNLGSKPEVNEIWNLLFDEIMINEIVLRTNKKLRKVRQTHKKIGAIDYKDTDVIEIRAFIGLLMLTSIYRSKHENMLSLFSSSPTGRPIFRAVMSLKRFEKLITCIRFDDATTRENRRQQDRAAAISFIFDRFVANSQQCFNLGPTTCIDEMLISFRGSCPFRIYTPNKQTKYSVKLLCLTDAGNSYFYNGYIYTGKDSNGKTLSSVEQKFQNPTQAVLHLAKPLEKSNKNITAGSCFSSVELLHQLQKKGLTYTGTIKKTEGEIPSEFLPSPKRSVGSTLYGFSKDNFTILSYVPRKSKAVLLVSSTHRTKKINTENSPPEMISFYNATKGGVDTLGTKCANYSLGRLTRRWPLAIFYTLVDISTNNAYVLFLHYKDIIPKCRRLFIEELAMNLVTPHMRRRNQCNRLNRELQILIRSVLGESNCVSEPSTSSNDRLNVRKMCSVCHYKKQRKTFYRCHTCEKPICLEHANKVCKDCINDQEPRMRRRIQNNKSKKRVIGENCESRPSTSSNDRFNVKKTCSICHYKKKRKTFYRCHTCEKPICLEHTNKVCKNCIIDQEER